MGLAFAVSPLHAAYAQEVASIATSADDLPDAPTPQLDDQQQQLQLPAPPSCDVAASTLQPATRSCISNSDRKEARRRFANSPRPLPLTPKGKLELAGLNVIDPFNLLTIGGLAAIDVAADPDGPYGPGMKGFAKESGTSLTQNINGEFWGTFVMASVFHQDPHYHRMPMAPLPRRIAHCFTAVLIAQSDHGKPMFNFVEVGGYTISASINNLYVPYGRTNVASTTARVATNMALDPIGNAITEFLPDLARHVNIQVVFVQRIINHITAQNGTGAD